MSAGLLDVWTRVRCFSRQTAPPVREGDVLVIASNESREKVRRVVLNPSPALIRRVVALGKPGTVVKFAGEPRAWQQEFPDGWELDHDGQWLTTVDHPSQTVPAVEGYRIVETLEPGRILVDVIEQRTGAAAAHGQAGVDGGWFVPDQISTEAAHRRRGLGAVVMTDLARLAAEQGAERGVLVASPDGRHLYAALGWREITPIVAASLNAEATADPTRP